MTTTGKVVSIDQPKCSRCNKPKPVAELNGHDPLAPIGKKYTHAYCRDLLKCNSEEAKAILKDLLN